MIYVTSVWIVAILRLMRRGRSLGRSQAKSCLTVNPILIPADIVIEDVFVFSRFYAIRCGPIPQSFGVLTIQCSTFAKHLLSCIYSNLF